MADKVTLASVASFQNDVTAVTAVNNNSASITTAFDNTLSRDGTSPNQMGANLDMNSNQILNLPAPATYTSPVRVIDIQQPMSSIPPILLSMDHQTVASFQGTQIPSTVSIVTLLGYYAPGDMTPATFKRSSAPTPPASLDGYIISADGAYWKYVPQNGHVYASAFGTYRNAVYGGIVTGTISGTSDTAAIQSAINFALQNNYPQVILEPGNYLSTDTIHLGWGSGFVTIDLIGDNSYNGATAGVSIFFTPLDRQCLNIQGGRNNRVRGISFNHTHGAWWVFHNIELFAGYYPSVATSWFDTVSFTTGLTQHAPIAAVTIDGFAGALPADHYPTVNYPAWTGLTYQYDNGNSSPAKSITSQVTIDQCEFNGFPVGIAAGVNSPNQGDFIRITSCAISWCAYGISINNTQSRNIEISNLNISFNHTVLNNNKFGTGGHGQLNGPISNISGGETYQVVDLDLSYAGPLTISHIYFEGLLRVGSIVQGASPSRSITFKDCIFNNSDGDFASGSYTSPRAQLEISGTVSVVFDSCNWSSIYRIGQLVWGAAARTTINNCVFYNGGKWTSSSGTGYNQAISYGGGIIINGSAAAPWSQDVIQGMNGTIYRTTGVEQGSIWMGDTLNVDYTGIPNLAILREGVQSFSDIFGRKWRILGRRAPNSTIAKSGGVSITSPSQVLDTLTFTYTLGSNTTNDYLVEVGDILIDQDTGNMFVITASVFTSTYAITAVQLNNYSGLFSVTGLSTGTFVPFSPTVFTSGVFRLIKTGVLMPTTIFYGNFISGNSSVNVDNGSGAATNLTSVIPVGMTLYCPVPIDPEYGVSSAGPVGSGTVVKTTTNGTPGVITLGDSITGAAKNATATGRFPITPVWIA